MKPKSFIVELLILIILFIIIIISVIFLPGVFWGNASLDINLHDTYFVFQFSRQNLILVPFLLLTLLVYAVRASINHFKNRSQNLVLIITDFLFVITLIKIYAFLSHIDSNSALPILKGRSLPANTHPVNWLEQTLLVSVIIFLLILVITAMLTGKNWNFNKNENQSS
jgi:hypothetical protein